MTVLTDETSHIADDALFAGRIALLQPAKGHRAGTDAVLLAAAAPRLKGVSIDVGAATGAVGLMAARGDLDARIVFVEQDDFLAQLCRRNIKRNAFRHAAVATADVLDAEALAANALLPGTADTVLTNPPFLEPDRARSSPHRGRAAAHMLTAGDLKGWIEACARLLKPRGVLCLIHRAERIGDILGALGTGFGTIAIRFAHPRAEAPAIRVVVRAVKGGRGPLGVAPPLILHDESGSFTTEAQALHDGSHPFLFEP